MGVGIVVDLDMGHAQWTVVLVEYRQDILLRAGHHTVNLDAGHHHHGLVLLYQTVGDGPIGLVATYTQRDRQRFRHLVVANQCYLLVIRTYINIVADGKRNLLLIQCIKHALCL